jgi:hypothetical protein
LALFLECQPLFIKVSEDLVKKFDLVAARDVLWRELSGVYLKIMQTIRAEEIETSYADLYAHRPQAREVIRESLSKLKLEQEKVFKELLLRIQDEVMKFKRKKKTYESAELGNALRTAANDVREEYSQVLQQALVPPQSFLFGLISQSDEGLLNNTGGKAEAASVAK